MCEPVSHARHANLAFKSKHPFQIALMNSIKVFIISNKRLAFNKCVTGMLTCMLTSISRHVGLHDLQPWLASLSWLAAMARMTCIGSHMDVLTPLKQVMLMYLYWLSQV